MTCNAVFAQLVPFHRIPLYFEDARGNRDTMSIAWDIRATGCDLSGITCKPDTLFGEFIQTEPFDSVLDARGVMYPWYGTITAKNVVDSGDESTISPGCQRGGGIQILVLCKYFPLKISWDDPRAPNCPSNWDYLLAPNASIVTSFPWWIFEGVYCMTTRNEIILNDLNSTGLLNVNKLDVQVKGKGMQEVPTLWFLQTSSGLCKYLSADDLDASALKEGTWLINNPTDGEVRWLSPSVEVKSITVFDQAGSLVRYYPTDDQEAGALDLSFLKSGLYHLYFATEYGVHTEKLIKI
jgi:hypothetical protein